MAKKVTVVASADAPSPPPKARAAAASPRRSGRRQRWLLPPSSATTRAWRRSPYSSASMVRIQPGSVRGDGGHDPFEGPRRKIHWRQRSGGSPRVRPRGQSSDMPPFNCGQAIVVVQQLRPWCHLEAARGHGESRRQPDWRRRGSGRPAWATLRRQRRRRRLKVVTAPSIPP